MNKIALAIGAILCVGLAGPKIIGGLVESEYNNIAQSLNENPSIEITERSFSTDWFSGEAITKFKIKGQGAELDSVEFVYQEDLIFGPLIVADSELTFALAHSAANINFELNNLEQSSVEQEELNAFIKALNEKLTMTSVISYTMDYYTKANLAEFSFDQDGNYANFGAIESEFVFEDDKYLSGFLNWSGIDLKGPEATLNVSPLTMDFSQEVISGDLYAGNAISSGEFTMQVEHISALDLQGNDLIRINNAAFSVASVIEQELMNLRLHYAADKLSGSGQNFEKLNLDFSMNKLEPEVLIELNNILVKIQQTPENEVNALFSQEFVAVATKLLVNNPEMNIDDFSVTTPEGNIKTDLKVTIDNALVNQANPMSIIAALQADAKGEAPALFFQKLGLEGMINMYVDQGLLLKNAETLSFAAQFEQGQLMVNGNPIPL